MEYNRLFTPGEGLMQDMGYIALVSDPREMIRLRTADDLWDLRNHQEGERFSHDPQEDLSLRGLYIIMKILRGDVKSRFFPN